MNRLIAEAAAPTGEIFAPVAAVYAPNAPVQTAGLTGPVTVQLFTASGERGAEPDRADAARREGEESFVAVQRPPWEPAPSVEPALVDLVDLHSRVGAEEVEREALPSDDEHVFGLVDENAEGPWVAGTGRDDGTLGLARQRRGGRCLHPGVEQHLAEQRRASRATTSKPPSRNVVSGLALVEQDARDPALGLGAR